MLVTPVEYLPQLGEVWKSWGGVWGGNRDPVHFQLPGAPSPELLAETKGAAAQEQQGAIWNPYLAAANLSEDLPWYVKFLRPWQLGIYRDYPIIRGLIDPAASIDEINLFFQNLTSS